MIVDEPKPAHQCVVRKFTIPLGPKEVQWFYIINEVFDEMGPTERNGIIEYLRSKYQGKI